MRRQLLQLTLRNARRSVWLLLLAGFFIAWKGFEAGAPGMAIFAAVLAASAAGWRFVLGSRATAGMSLRQVARAETEVSANALLAGLLWAGTTVGIYPLLEPRSAGEHLVILVGSAAAAAHFMTLVPWAYVLLVVPSIGAIAFVSAIDGRVQSPSLVVLSTVYMATLLVAGRAYRETATQAIAHSLELETTLSALQKSKEDAEAGIAAKSQFLATMSHEIRTPMNGVLGSLELLRRSGLSAEQGRLVRTAASSGTSLMAILNDVLDHSKIEAGKLQLDERPMSVRELAASVVGLFLGNAQARGLWLRLHVEDDLPDGVVGDSQRLKQVLLNLVSNAIKFTDTGGVDLTIRGARTAAHEAQLSFCVADTGIGLSEDAIGRLFVPFTQLADGGNGTRDGTGLGLSISQRIVEAMGSRIRVRSAQKAGAQFSFTLRLPLHDDRPAPAAPETDLGALSAMSPLAGTVLVAEDNPVNRLIARSMLESLGLTVLEAADGVEALEQTESHPVDLVLMDCQMPRLDGFEATRRWREREHRRALPRTPILALTASAVADDIANVLRAGMDGRLAKPYTRKQLREQLDTWL